MILKISRTISKLSATAWLTALNISARYGQQTLRLLPLRLILGYHPVPMSRFARWIYQRGAGSQYRDLGVRNRLVGGWMLGIKRGLVNKCCDDKLETGGISKPDFSFRNKPQRRGIQRLASNYVSFPQDLHKLHCRAILHSGCDFCMKGLFYCICGARRAGVGMRAKGGKGGCP